MHLLFVCGAGEDRLHVLALMATKAENYHQLLPYSPKEGWWTMAMAKCQI